MELLIILFLLFLMMGGASGGSVKCPSCGSTDVGVNTGYSCPEDYHKECRECGNEFD